MSSSNLGKQDQNITRRFAWDGFSFRVPLDWNLSNYSLRRDVSMVQMEDDDALRLEMEWIRAKTPIKQSRLQDRCASAGKQLTGAGAETAIVRGIPEGWAAVMYSMPDGRHLLIAYRLVPRCPFFCFFQLHFSAASRREPPRMIRQIASSFRIHEHDPVPWEFYDIAFRLDKEFRLVNTSFQAGRKMMVFEWRFRRLFIWFFSLADVILREKRIEQWAVEFLNGFKGLQCPKFVSGQNGEIRTRINWRYPLGQFEEIFRWCFRYKARCIHLPEKNQIALYVFNYRNEIDISKIAADLPK